MFRHDESLRDHKTPLFCHPDLFSVSPQDLQPIVPKRDLKTSQLPAVRIDGKHPENYRSEVLAVQTLDVADKIPSDTVLKSAHSVPRSFLGSPCDACDEFD